MIHWMTIQIRISREWTNQFCVYQDMNFMEFPSLLINVHDIPWHQSFYTPVYEVCCRSFSVLGFRGFPGFRAEICWGLIRCSVTPLDFVSFTSWRSKTEAEQQLEPWKIPMLIDSGRVEKNNCFVGEKYESFVVGKLWMAICCGKAMNIYIYICMRDLQVILCMCWLLETSKI